MQMLRFAQHDRRFFHTFCRHGPHSTARRLTGSRGLLSPKLALMGQRPGWKP
jgi:hypothetical protein